MYRLMVSEETLPALARQGVRLFKRPFSCRGVVGNPTALGVGVSNQKILKRAGQDTRNLRLSAGTVVCYYAVLNAIRSHLVRPLAASHLLPAHGVIGVSGAIRGLLRHSGLEQGAGVHPVTVLTLTSRLGRDSGRYVAHDHTRLGLVAVLPARARILGDVGLDVIITQAGTSRRRRRQDGYGYCRRVNPSAALCRRNPLPAVSTGLGKQQG